MAVLAAFRWLGWQGWVNAIQLVFLGSALITLAHFAIVDVRGSAKRWHAQWTRFVAKAKA